MSTEIQNSTTRVIARLKEISVYDFFCPEDTRACSPAIAKRVYELCSAANIKTIGQLSDYKLADLRAKSFPEDLLPYISQRLHNAYPGLRLSTHFAPKAEKSAEEKNEVVAKEAPTVSARGVAPAISALSVVAPLSPNNIWASPVLPTYGK